MAAIDFMAACPRAPRAGFLAPHRIALIRLFAALVMALTSATGARAGDPAAIPFIAKAGARYMVDIRKERVTRSNGAGETLKRSHLVYDAVIESAGSGGLVLVWTLASQEAEDIEPPRGPPVFEFDALIRSIDIPIRIEADSSGLPLRIVNRANVEARIRATLAAEADAPGAEASLRDNFKAAAERSLFTASDDAFAATLFPEAGLLSRVQAISMPRDETVEQVSLAPNPWGGSAMSFIERYRIASEDAGTLTIEVEGELDPKSVKDSIDVLLQSLADEMGISIEAARESLGLIQLARHDSTTYVVSKMSGWTEKIAVKRNTVSNSPGQNLEGIETVEVAVARK